MLVSFPLTQNLHLCDTDAALYRKPFGSWLLIKVVCYIHSMTGRIRGRIPYKPKYFIRLSTCKSCVCNCMRWYSLRYILCSNIWISPETHKGLFNPLWVSDFTSCCTYNLNVRVCACFVRQLVSWLVEKIQTLEFWKKTLSDDKISSSVYFCRFSQITSILNHMTTQKLAYIR